MLAIVLVTGNTRFDFTPLLGDNPPELVIPVITLLLRSAAVSERVELIGLDISMTVCLSPQPDCRLYGNGTALTESAAPADVGYAPSVCPAHAYSPVRVDVEMRKTT